MSRGSVAKRGDVWRARFYDGEGRERQKSFERKGLATAWLNEQLSKVASGEWVDPAAGNVRFAAYAADWLASQHVRPSTARLQEMRLRLYINPIVGELQLRHLRRSHVVAIVSSMATAGLTPGVVKYAVGTLRAVLASAVADRLVVSNVAADRSIAMPRQPREVTVPLTAEEIAAIAAAITPRLRALVLLGAATGLRSGELRGLTADRITPAVHLAALTSAVAATAVAPATATALDVTPRHGVVRVDRQLVVGRVLAPCKTDSSVRDVAIGPTTLAMLRHHVREHGLGSDGFIFTTTVGTPIDASQLSVAWSRALRAADVRTDVVVHDLRHHHASELLSQGLNIAAVAKRLGHSSPTITLASYAHCMPSDSDRALAISEDIASRLG